MTVLIQFVHPYPERSRVNRALIDTVRQLPNVRLNDLYAFYPRMHVDVQREQRLLREAELILFQHPFYWYSGPSLLKEWIDSVLENGFAFGAGGTALAGKAWLHSLTTGMPEQAYRPDGTNETTIGELLRPFERTARFCGMRWLEPLVLHDAHTADDARIARHAERLRALIESHPR